MFRGHFQKLENVIKLKLCLTLGALGPQTEYERYIDCENSYGIITGRKKK